MKTSMLIGPAIMLLQKNYLSDITTTTLIYIAATLTSVSVAMLILLYQRISNSRQEGSVTYKSKDAQGTSKEHVVSIKEYDQVELRKLSGQMLLGTLVVSGLYLWKQFTQPMLIQPIMSVVQCLESPLAQIYFFGKVASGPIARPFKEDNPLAKPASMCFLMLLQAEWIILLPGKRHFSQNQIEKEKLLGGAQPDTPEGEAPAAQAAAPRIEKKKS